jgi:hypothetical protein
MYKLSARSICLYAGLIFTHPLVNAQEYSSIFNCTKNLHLPRHGLPGASSETIGPVTVTVVPDSNGGIRSLTIEGGPDSATILLKSWLSESTFVPQCTGKKLIVRFSFIVEGTPIDYPFTWITFQGPNHFTIHSRPRLPHILHGPSQSRKN